MLLASLPPRASDRTLSKLVWKVDSTYLNAPSDHISVGDIVSTTRLLGNGPPVHKDD